MDHKRYQTVSISVWPRRASPPLSFLLMVRSAAAGLAQAVSYPEDLVEHGEPTPPGSACLPLTVKPVKWMKRPSFLRTQTPEKVSEDGHRTHCSVSVLRVTLAIPGYHLPPVRINLTSRGAAPESLTADCWCRGACGVVGKCETAIWWQREDDVQLNTASYWGDINMASCVGVCAIFPMHLHLQQMNGDPVLTDVFF